MVGRKKRRWTVRKFLIKKYIYQKIGYCYNIVKIFHILLSSITLVSWRKCIEYTYYFAMYIPLPVNWTQLKIMYSASNFLVFVNPHYWIFLGRQNSILLEDILSSMKCLIATLTEELQDDSSVCSSPKQ